MVLEFPGTADWESWLTAHHQTETDAWLRIGKQHSGAALLTITDALDVALCFGWIDGQRKANDELSYLQRYSRRRPGGSWSMRCRRMSARTMPSRGSADPIDMQ